MDKELEKIFENDNIDEFEKYLMSKKLEDDKFNINRLGGVDGQTLLVAAAAYDKQQIFSHLCSQPDVEFQVRGYSGKSLVEVARTKKRKRILVILLNAISEFLSQIDHPDQLAKQSALLSSAFADVTELSLSNCQLTAVPSALWTVLRELKSLDLSHNKIQLISPAVGNLTNLRSLNVSSNLLDFLPPQLGDMEQLHKLEISNNPLSTMPYEVKFGTSNEGLNLGGAAGGIQNLKMYLSGLHNAVDWKRIKLMLLGQEGVGKTSIQKAFTKVKDKKTQVQQVTGDTVSTDGIDVTKWGTSGITFSIWDFGGQSVFYPTHQFYITNRSLYLLVFDASKDITMSRVGYWLKLLKSMTESPPVFLVGTHIDVDGFNAARKKQVETNLKRNFPGHTFPNIKGIYFVSTKPKGKKTIKALIKGVVKLAQKQKLLKTRVPHYFFTVETAIDVERARYEKENRPPIMTFRQFAKILNSYEIPIENIPGVVNFFNDVGSIVYFSEVASGNAMPDLTSDTSSLDTASATGSSISLATRTDSNSSISSASSHSISASTATMSVGQRILQKYGNDTVVINPQWLTRVMSSVITFTHRFIQNGILDHSKLGQMWKQYPRSLHPTLLHILQRFEIAHPLPVVDNQHRSIVPSLLPERRPADLSKLWPRVTPYDHNEAGRIYQFRFTPLGFFSRLLVRVFQMAEIEIVKDTCWRSGVLVQCYNQTALIDFDSDAHRLNIAVRTPLRSFASGGGIDAAWKKKQHRGTRRAESVSLGNSRSGSGDDGKLARTSTVASSSAATLAASSSKRSKRSRNKNGKNSVSTSAVSRSSKRSKSKRRHTTADSDSDGTSDNNGQKPLLLRQLIELVETLLDNAYNQLLSSTHRSIPCSHCLLSRDLYADTYLFSYEKCLQAIQSGEAYVYCCEIPNRPVRIDTLAPDLVFSDLPVLTGVKRLEKLGEGAFGIVYKGEMSIKAYTKVQPTGDDDSDSHSMSSSSTASLSSSTVSTKTQKVIVAIKELQSQDTDETVEKFQEFQKEVYIMSCLRHSNLVQLYGISLRPLSMIMEFMSAGDLYHLINNKNVSDDMMPYEVRLKIALEISAGMAYLHSLTPPVSHCDLRSPNIFLAHTGDVAEYSPGKTIQIRAKVADFGLARRVFSSVSGFFGTWQWLAPEVIDIDTEEFTEKADVYSFGIIMWEIMSREFPFQEFKQFQKFMGKDSDGKDHYILKAREIKQAIIDDGLRPTVPDGTPDDFAQLMQECWRKSPTERPPFTDIYDRLAAMAIQKGIDITQNQDIVSIDSFKGATAQAKQDPKQAAASMIEYANVSLKCDAESILGLLYVDEMHEVWVALSSGSVIIYSTDNWSKVGEVQISQKSVYALKEAVGEVWACTSDGHVAAISLAKKSISGRMTGDSDALFRSIEWVHCLAGAQNNKVVDEIWAASPTDQQMYVFDRNKKKQINTFPIAQPPTAILQVGKVVWVGSAPRGVLFLFNALTKEMEYNVNAHNTMIKAIVKTKYNQVWTASDDKVVRVWSDKCQLLRTLHGQSSKIRTLMAIDRHVWSAGFSGDFLLYDAKAHFPLAEVSDTKHNEEITGLAWVYPKTIVSACRNAEINVWRYTDKVKCVPPKQKDDFLMQISGIASSSDSIAASSSASSSSKTKKKRSFFGRKKKSKK